MGHAFHAEMSRLLKGNNNRPAPQECGISGFTPINVDGPAEFHRMDRKRPPLADRETSSTKPLHHQSRKRLRTNATPEENEQSVVPPPCTPFERTDCSRIAADQSSSGQHSGVRQLGSPLPSPFARLQKLELSTSLILSNRNVNCNPGGSCYSAVTPDEHNQDAPLFPYPSGGDYDPYAIPDSSSSSGSTDPIPIDGRTGTGERTDPPPPCTSTDPTPTCHGLIDEPQQHQNDLTGCDRSSMNNIEESGEDHCIQFPNERTRGLHDPSLGNHTFKEQASDWDRFSLCSSEEDEMARLLDDTFETADAQSSSSDTPQDPGGAPCALVQDTGDIKTPHDDLLSSDIDWDEVVSILNDRIPGAATHPTFVERSSQRDIDARSCHISQSSPLNGKAEELHDNGALSEGEKDMTPFVRPGFPKPVRDRSPVTGISSSAILRICFRIGELLNEASRCSTQITTTGAVLLDENVTFEFFSRVTYSHREASPSRIQHFQFQDMFKEQRPFPTGTLQG